ncbi:hypothetical protein B0H10DRAFT_2355736 [Mycena sp. CBHHK59/15]|nr:hypothetical protein B0H10DRAFT_2355736 [Mycena sp. CBHHK59/15]
MHLFRTRYTLELEGLKGSVAADTIPRPICFELGYSYSGFEDMYSSEFSFPVSSTPSSEFDWPSHSHTSHSSPTSEFAMLEEMTSPALYPAPPADWDPSLAPMLSAFEAAPRAPVTHRVNHRRAFSVSIWSAKSCFLTEFAGLGFGSASDEDITTGAQEMTWCGREEDIVLRLQVNVLGPVFGGLTGNLELSQICELNANMDLKLQQMTLDRYIFEEIFLEQESVNFSMQGTQGLRRRGQSCSGYNRAYVDCQAELRNCLESSQAISNSAINPNSGHYDESCIVLEICTETVSRTLIYRPEQLDASTRIVLNPVQEDSSTTEFRMQHQLHRAVGLHVVHIAQPDGNPVTHTPASFLTSRYAYERDILAFLPHGGFGAVYVHYARYRILSRIAGEVGLQINKPSQESSTNTVPLTYLDLLAWAGVNAGSFGNEKALIMRSEQLRWELSLQDNPTAANAVLRNHLNALAAEPVRSMTSRDPSLAWSVVDLRARLPANVIGPRHHYQHRRG